MVDLYFQDLPAIAKAFKARTRHFAKGRPMFEFSDPLDAHPDTGELYPNTIWIQVPSWSGQTAQPRHLLRIGNPKAHMDDKGRITTSLGVFKCNCQDRQCKRKETCLVVINPDGTTDQDANCSVFCKHQEAFIQDLFGSLTYYLFIYNRDRITEGRAA